MKTYFVFLSLLILAAARQIQIKNLREEKQEKLLHSSPISRPLKRNRRGRRGAWGWSNKDWFKKSTDKVAKAAKDAAKAVIDAAKAGQDAAKAVAAKAAEDAAKDTSKFDQEAAKNPGKWYVQNSKPHPPP